ncbi:hypothetical protein Syun_014535 [Stephania yunnanensis]|uniref:Uncharacterized protein n=1 Tax=Stephania yunnanensis TaxID=152371 RepID=A0AAP0PBY2_9MAGN
MVVAVEGDDDGDGFCGGLVRRGVRRMKGGGAVAKLIWALRDGRRRVLKRERRRRERRRRLLLHRFGSHFSHRSTAPSNSSKRPPLPLPRARATATTPPSPPCPSTTKHHRPNHAFDLALTPHFVAYTLSAPLVYTVAIPTTSSSSSPTPTASSPFASSRFRHEDADASSPVVNAFSQ